MVVEQVEPNRDTAPSRSSASAVAYVLVGAVCGIAWGAAFRTYMSEIVGGASRVALAKAAASPAAGADKGRRRAYFPETGGWIDCPIYDRYQLAAGQAIPGPAIVEERESTVIVGPGAQCCVDEQWNLMVELPVTSRQSPVGSHQ